MKRMIKLIITFVLCFQSVSLMMPASAQTSPDLNDSPLTISVNGSDEVNLVVDNQQIEVRIEDQLAEEENQVVDTSKYTLSLPEGISYDSSSSKISVDNQGNQLNFEFLDQQTNVAVLKLNVTKEQILNPVTLQVHREGGGLSRSSNVLTITPTLEDEQAVEEVPDTSNETETEVKQASAEYNTQGMAWPVSTKYTNLENDMVVTEDFPNNLDVATYLSQYQYPNLPSGGASDAYRSVEKDVHSYAGNAVALVRSRDEFDAALNNSSIKVISIAKSFVLTSSITRSRTNNPIVIEGNGMLIDFKLNRVNVTGDADVTIQNLNMYHANYYGAVRATGASSIQKFHNVNDYGSQILSSQGMPVQISGDFISRFVTTNYISPIDGTTVATQYNLQQNFESSNIEFFQDSVTTLETYNGANIDLTAAGEVVVYENAKLNLIAGNKTNAAGEGSSGYGISARQESSFIMQKNSEVNYNYTDPGNGTRDQMGVVWFQSAGSTFTMNDGAKMTVNKNGHSGNNGIIHFNRSGTFNLNSGSSIEMNVQDHNNGAIAVSLNRYGTDLPDFNISGNSKMNLNMTNTGAGTNPILNLGDRAKMRIDTGSTLEIRADGYQRSIISLGTGISSSLTSFSLGADATLDVNSIGRNNTSYDVVTVGNYASFSIQRLGSFILSANRARYIFNVGSNSTFQFSDSKMVDFGFTEKPATTSALINMNGNFLVDIQRVKAWERSSGVLNDDQPNYDWNPMFDMVLPYSGTTVNNNSIKGSSTTSGTAKDFKAKYNTGTNNGFQRLLFEFIPDVEVTMDNDPVDNATNENSRKIIGTTNPFAFVRISDTVVSGGYSSFPTSNNTIPDPTEYSDGSVGENYTVQAGSNGHFEFEVPTSNNIPFVAGNTIKVYAYLNGKSSEDSKVVADTTAPTANVIEQFVTVNSAVPSAASFVPDLADTNPAGNPVATFAESQEELNGYLATPGVHDVTILGTDAAGNQSTFPTKLHVFAKSADVTGDNVTLTSEEIENMNQTEFRQLIKDRVNADAYKLETGNYIDLTGKITYDFTLVEQSPGTYNLILKVSQANSGVTGGLTKTVTVTVLNIGSTAPVDPDNPQKNTIPPEGSENGGTGATGYLRMDYAPSKINFGNVPFSYNDTTYNARKPLNQTGSELSKQWIQISDDRSNENGWSVKVGQEGAFTSQSGETLLGTSLIIPKGKIRNSEVAGDIDTDGPDAKMSAHEISLNENSEKTIFGAKDKGTDSAGKKISTYQWDPTQVNISVPGGAAKVSESYSGTINWSLVSEPMQ